MEQQHHDAAGGGSARPKVLDVNRDYYDALWGDAKLVEPQRFNTWPLVESLAAAAENRLEVAPGLRPRLPLSGTQFLDFSLPALRSLQQRGASVSFGEVRALPFAAEAFDFVCALDIVEHVENDGEAFAELSRVTRPGGTLLLSVPLHQRMWTPFDDFVGHFRRYEPALLWQRLVEHKFTVEQSAVYGMQPRSSKILDLGMWWLTHDRERAMWWYNKVFMPLGLRFQKPLVFMPGKVDTEQVDEILLVCRKNA